MSARYLSCSRLIPAAIIGAYAGVAVGGAAAGAFGTRGFRHDRIDFRGRSDRCCTRESPGGIGRSRRVGIYEEALKRGLSKEEADIAANEVFWGNMRLVGMDAAQFALAFTPLRLAGPAARRVMNIRSLVTAAKLGTVALSEAGEERYQETLGRKALGDPVSFFDFDDPQLNEAGVIGAIFGVGMGGAGTVWQGLSTHVVNSMDAETKNTFETAREDAIKNGATEEAAEIQALDIIADTPEGKTLVEDAMKGLEEIGKGNEVEGIKEKILALRDIFAKQEAEEALPEEAEERVQRIADDVTAQLQSAGMSEADAQIHGDALYGTFFRQNAKRAGIDVEELYQSYGLSVARERAVKTDSEGITYDQSGRIVEVHARVPEMGCG